MYSLTRLFTLAFSVLLSGAALADSAFRLGPLFTDHAVFQRDQAVPVWGWAAPGAQVEVEFKGAKASATADEKGRWQASLPASPASAEPAELVARSGASTLTVSDVLVGEVWMCSGQSNMEWRVDQAANAKEEMAAAKYPLIRHVRVPKVPSDTPITDFQADWKPAGPETVAQFSAVAFFFARDLHRTLDVPIGLINTSWGGKWIEVFMSPEALAATPYAAKVKERWDQERETLPAKIALWDKKKAEAEAQGKKPGGLHPGEVVAQHQPSCLFHGMISPVIPYGIRGVIWYQGEHNISRADEYAVLFAGFIGDLRKRFGQGDFPFYFVQLANYEAKLDKSGEGFAKLREAQRQTLALPNTGMAVTIDIGTPGNVHPTNKQDVGARLARWALARTYGIDRVVSGPLFKSAARDGSAVRVDFDFADGLVAKPEPLGSFEIAGADGKFVAAEAKIEGGAVIVQAAQVPSPAAVRYAWGNAPTATLFNREGLPASPFQTSLGAQ